MKKTNQFKMSIMVILLTFLSCSSKSKGEREPEKIGIQVFEILKNFDKNSNQEFHDNHVSYLEISKIANSEKIGDKKEWDSYILNRYNRISKFGDRWGIDWEKIEYLSFKYQQFVTNLFKRLIFSNLNACFLILHNKT